SFRRSLCAYLSPFLFFLLIPPPPISTLFPYTTLFRSHCRGDRERPSVSVQRFHGPLIAMLALRWARPLIREGASIDLALAAVGEDRKSTRLNSSHLGISYAVFCLKKKKK